MLVAAVNLLEKVAPKAVTALGKAGVLELVGLASIGAEGLNLVVDKGGKFIKEKVAVKAAAKKQEMLERKAALLEQKAQMEKAAASEVAVQPEEVKEKEVEEKPKTSNKKKGK